MPLAVKIAAWFVGSLLALFLLLGCTLAVLLHSARFHQYLLKMVQVRASDALGVGVHLRDFNLSLAALHLDLYGVQVDGASPYANPPLLTVDHAEAGVRIVSLFRAKWYLESIRVDRPVAHIFVDAQGRSNLPTVQSSTQSSGNSTSIFDLAIRHAVLAEGQFYYNDKKSVLAADLHNVDLQASYNVALQKYSGRLAYSDGHLYSGKLDPIPHNLDVEFDLTPTIFHLAKARLSTGASQVVLTATANNYSSPNPVVDGSYDVLVDGEQVGQILKDATIPKGQIRLTGKLHYLQAANQPLLDAITVDGDLNSRELAMKTPSMRANINNLSAHYALVNGNAVLQDLHANLLGGYLTAAGKMNDVAGEMQSQVDASLRNISLAEVRRATGSSATMAGVSVTGKLNVKASANWKKALEGLVARADTTIQGQIAGVANGTVRNSIVPIDSAIHGRYTTSADSGQKSMANSGILTVSQSYLRTRQTNLTLDGTVSQKSSLHLRLQADDLREVETIADLFRTPEPGKALEPLGLSGTASFDGRVQGSMQAPHLSGQLLASNLNLHGTQWKMIRAGLDAGPAQVRVDNAEFDLASRGRITLSATAGLDKWSFTKTSPVQMKMDASQLDIAELMKAAGQQPTVSGTLNANLNLHGSELHPEGDGNLNITKAVAYDQPVSSLKVAFHGTGEDAHADLAVVTPAGSVQGQLGVQPVARRYTMQLSTNGINLNKLQALTAHNMSATGTLTLNASGQGSFDNPQANLTLQIPQLVIQGQTVTGIKLQADVANHVGRATLASSAVNTSIQAKATVNLTGDYEADASVDTQAIPFQPLLAVYEPDQAANITGETELHATLHGPLKDKNRLEAHVTIPMLKVGYGKDIQLAAAAPIRIDYVKGVVNLQRSAIRGTGTDLQFQGSIPIANTAAMAVMLQGTVNLELAQLFDPDIRSAGQLKFNLNSSGASNYGGEINVVNASFASADLPVGLQHGNGTLTLTKGRLTVTSFEGQVGGGTVTAQGGVNLLPTMQMDVGLTAQGIRMLYPQGVRESIDANIRLAGSADDAQLSGSVNLSDISFTSAFDLNSMISQLSGGTETPPSAGFAQNLRLNLSVQSSNDIALVSRTLSLGGTANLQVRGTAANPVILGRINLNNGDIILNGDRFVLEGGTIQFVNPNETQPVLNVSLKTNIQQYDVYLRFNGPIDQLRTNYSSDPALPSADIINLLAFGSTTEASAQNSASTTTNQQAASLVASQVSSQVTSRISKVAGISQLSINPLLNSGSGQQAGANITIQQRVTGNLFVTFSSNVASTQSQTIQGQYQVSPRVAVSATRDQNGGFAFDAIIKKTW